MCRRLAVVAFGESFNLIYDICDVVATSVVIDGGFGVCLNLLSRFRLILLLVFEQYDKSALEVLLL